MNDQAKHLELKVQALRERLAQIVTEYEDRVADLRVNLTLQQEQLQAYQQQSTDNEPLEGEVVN